MNESDDESAEHQAFLERMKAGRTDIGGDHWIKGYTGTETDVQIGFSILHKKANGKWCIGSVMFDIPEAQRFRTTFLDGHKSAVWTLHSREPLHIEPSILCACGDHGWIRNGRWVPA